MHIESWQNAFFCDGVRWKPLKPGILYVITTKLQKYILPLEQRLPIKQNNRAGSHLIYGVQKSGTTVIANALSYCAKKSLTSDHIGIWPIVDIKAEERSQFIKSLVERHPLTLSRTFIKEPSMTLAPELFSAYYPNASILVIRNPLDTIRSILDRLNIHPSSSTLDEKAVHPGWKHVFKLGSQDPPFIQLADYWVRCMSNPHWDSKSVFKVYYNEFLAHPDDVVSDALSYLDLKMKRSSKMILSTQFQSKGANRNAPLESITNAKTLSLADEMTRPVYEHLKQGR